MNARTIVRDDGSRLQQLFDAPAVRSGGDQSHHRSMNNHRPGKRVSPSAEPARPQRAARAAPAKAKANAEAAAPRTQRERRTEAEMRLLATARQLIARRGWTGTTLAEVGEAAGYSRGLAGHYFGSKNGLLRAITQQINNAFFDELKKAPPVAHGLETIVSFVSVYLSRRDPEWLNTRALLLLMTEALLEGSKNADQMLNYNASVLQYLEENIRIGIASGEIDKAVSPPVGAEFVVGTLRGMMLQRLIRGGDINAPVLRKNLVALVRRAFAPSRS